MKRLDNFRWISLTPALVIFLLMVTIISNATNPPITTALKNLSQGLLPAEYEDFNPEMVIEGNTVHAVWTNRVGNSEGYLFYCRSTDLGETWETAKQIYQFKDGGKATDVTAQRLAVSGNHVYIGLADYDYYNNGTGFIYFTKSSDGGATFDGITELANSGGGYSALTGCHIRAFGNKVALVYRDANYNNSFEGLYCLFSGDNGNSFNQSQISEDNTTSITDFQFTDDLIIVVHEFAYYYYGLNTGRVFVSVSDNDGTSFTTNKVSVTYSDDYGEHERCRCYHDARYVPKVVKDGNNIHLIFCGNNQEGIWSILYTRSTDNGQSFEEAVDINKGKISNLQTGQETLAAKGGNVYLTYLSTGSKPYLVRSGNGGETLSEPQDLLTENTHYIQTTWWPQLVIDPTDETGKTVYFGSGAMMTRKSVDGGQNFRETTFLAPFVSSPHVEGSDLVIDNSGIIHWLSKAHWKGSYDFDIFYGNIKPQPDPGEMNKAFYLETTWYDKRELAIVPSSPGIEFDSLITGEAWVKMLPGSGLHQNIFTKMNGYDGDFYQSPGYQLTFDDNYGKRRFEAGIQTDKGEFINWTATDINDTLWHHIAFTYDAGAEINNFKSYLDGLLVAQQTVTGSIIPGDGMLMIGSRVTFSKDSKYMIDDIRLWNRALSQEELLENLTKTFTGNEDSLKLWLTFDDTFKDMSGNGNDAIPLYLGECRSSDFDPPLTGFDMYQTANEISFNNKTTNANTYLWNFGNDDTSEQGNPQYTYSTAGEYQISLTAQNATTVTSAVGQATIEGLDHIEPVKAGNYGSSFITLFGGGLTVEGTTVFLRKEGNPDIPGSNLVSPSPEKLTAVFDLNNLPSGKWDFVMKRGTSEHVLPAAFEIIPATLPDTWVNVSGRGQFLPNKWTTYTVNYGNNGNVDAFFVPVIITITDNGTLETEMIDFEMEGPSFISDITEEDGTIKGIGTINGTEYNTKSIAFIIPVIQANTSQSVHLRIRSSESFYIRCWDSQPLISNNEEFSELLKSAQALPSVGDFTKCMANAALDEIQSYVFSQLLSIYEPLKEYAGCAYTIGKEGLWYLFSYSHERTKKKFVTATGGAILDCLSDATKNSIEKFIKNQFKANHGMIAIRAIFHALSCMWDGQPAQGTLWDILYNMVMSFDPNEMAGPSGFGTQNWIQKSTPVPYTIYFENKSEATAPAHEVYITDTLDLSSFDITDFGFGSFGWGDSIFSPPGSKMKEFSMDIDLRPGLELITRVSGKLDTLTGIVKWEFLSLNPGTLDLEEDPFLGFLPPNVSSPEGEGFVSFSVGLKEELGTGDEIRNKASIVFDANQPIITNEYLNTLDLDVPQSRVYPLEATIDSRFPVDWTGSDEGSGIAGYTIYVLKNDTLLYPWLINTSEVTSLFEGEVGSTYKFYSLAKDHVNHEETTPNEYDAQTTITVDVEAFERMKENLKVWPNPVRENLQVTFSHAPCGMYAIELVGASGSVKHSRLYEDTQLQNGITIDVSDCPTGNYILRLIFGNKSETRKVVVH